MPSPSLRRLVRVHDLLRDCHAQPIQLVDCADEAELSPWHLLRSFRDVFGETPHEYLTRVRVEKARHLLAVTGRSVTDVCFDVGFTSLGSFSTLFKRHVGESPAAFRRRVRGWVAVPAAAGWVFVPCCFAHLMGGPAPYRNIREADGVAAG
jgi:AraC-like DNA-binding protein